MADKRISDFPTVTEAKDDDLLLIDSEQETYNIKMLTIRQAALSMVQDEVNKMNSDIKNIESAVAGVQDDVSDVSEAVKKNTLALLEKVDGGYVGEDGCLYLTADDAVVVGPLGPFAGTGGGGGSGGGSGNNATLMLTNTSGWLAATVAQGGSCVIKANWSSLENELSTGAGTLTVRVNGSTKTTRSVDQGDISIDVKDYLNSGTNSVKLTITDVYGNNRTINFSITVVSVSLSSTFDETVIFTGAIAFTYIPVGNIEKTVHFILDGREIDTAVTSVSGRQQSYLIPAQTHGTHALQVYFTCDVDGNEIRSNELYYEIICAVDGDMHPAIASNYRESEVVQYTSIPITYRVYDPSNMTTEVKQYANDELVSTQTVDRTEQTWTYRADKTGSLNLRIDADNGYATASKSWDISVTESNIDVSAETEDLSLYLSSYGRSNNEENPGVWSYKDIAATFMNFNFVSDGWQMDKDKISVLRVAGDARLEIPLKIFEKDFRSTGKTIELEFSTGEVMDYDAVILSCMSGGRGVELTAQRATMKSEQSEIFTSYKEDEHIRIAFVVEKRSENRLIQCYINGIMSGAVQYPTDKLTNNDGITNLDMGTSTTSDQHYRYSTSITLTLDNYDNVVKDGMIINTVDFSYNYKSEYSKGTLSSNASAEAKIDVSLPEYVIDFGLPLEISDMDDMLGNLTIVGGTASYGSVIALDSGKGFTYKPNRVLKGVDYVSLSLSGNKSYAVRIYPTTTVYYEESFATSTDFKTNDTPTSTSQQAAKAGTDAYNYGYDKSYADETTRPSGGTALVSSTVGDKAEFAFTGTGVDVYANTSTTSGKATILVRKDGTLKKMIMVETAMVSGSSDATKNQAVTAYNVPIASIDMTDYGNYSITIVNTQSKTTNSDNKISIDGFRVYNTLQDDMANAVYALDGEANPIYTELRNHVLSALNVTADTSKKYADQIANDAYSQVYSSVDATVGAVIFDSSSDSSENYSIEQGSAQDLLDNGPKNELYLYPGQTVTFKLNYDAQIGLKALNKTVSYSISGGNSSSKTNSNLVSAK